MISDFFMQFILDNIVKNDRNAPTIRYMIWYEHDMKVTSVDHCNFDIVWSELWPFSLRRRHPRTVLAAASLKNTEESSFTSYLSTVLTSCRCPAVWAFLFHVSPYFCVFSVRVCEFVLTCWLVLSDFRHCLRRCLGSLRLGRFVKLLFCCRFCYFLGKWETVLYSGNSLFSGTVPQSSDHPPHTSTYMLFAWPLLLYR